MVPLRVCEKVAGVAELLYGVMKFLFTCSVGFHTSKSFTMFYRVPEGVYRCASYGAVK